jgi:transcriptional regulator with XRE-family HTH domain
METIGIKVKGIRKRHKMNQIEFSEKIGISQGRLSVIEQDKTKPSADKLIQLRKQFNIDLNGLLHIE